MKVLGISGSMRKEGNTSLLVQKILEYVDAEGCSEIETEFISLAGMSIAPCTGCEKCRETKWCVLPEDDWEGVVNKIIDCDLLVVGSPTYYFDVCGHLKNFIDRTYSVLHDRKLAGRHAVVVSVCAERGMEHTLKTLEGFVNVHEMAYIGCVGGKGYAAGDVLEDNRAISKAKEVAGKITGLLREPKVNDPRLKS